MNKEQLLKDYREMLAAELSRLPGELERGDRNLAHQSVDAIIDLRNQIEDLMKELNKE